MATAGRGFAYYYVLGLALLMTLLGSALLIGGAWLGALGGSWYYLLAGGGLLATALLLFQRVFAAVWIYVGVFLFSCVWAVWEKGFDLWPQVPRVIGPLIVLILVALAAPALWRADRRPVQNGAGALLAVGFAGVAMGVTVMASMFAERPVPPAPVTTEMAEPATTPAQATAVTDPAQDRAGEDWPAYGGTYHALRYSSLGQMTPQNVAQLTQVWEYRTGDMPTEAAEGKYSPENTPLKIGDSVFICSAMGIAIAVDAATGAEKWRFDPEVSTDAIPYGATCRGMAYHTVGTVTGADATTGAAATGDCATRIIWNTLDARLLAVDAGSGAACAGFGTNGQVNLNNGIGETVPGWYAVTSAPTIVRGVIVVGAQVKDGQAEDAPSGVIRGYDAVTGDLRWAWDMGNPDLNGAPPAGQTYTRGTPNMWTTATGDEELGLVYLPMGNSSVDYYGSNRSEAENTYSTSLVAIDVTTGEPAWHFKTVRNDVWDYDLGGQATLVDFPGDGGTIPALVLPSKQGDIFVLDRRTGDPLHDVAERAVPGGGVEPDYLSPVQPFSGYHTLAKDDLTEKDMWGFTALDQLWCRIEFRRSDYDGIYTPPSTDAHWIQYPGYNGGSDWGGVAVDPTRGVIVANYNDMPNHNRLVPRAEADAVGLRPINDPAVPEGETVLGEAGPQKGAPYAIDVNAGWRVPLTGLLCKEPPYGGIRAIDLATGQTLWDRPLGTARKNGPFGIPSYLPLDIGTPNNGGAVITAGGLVFIAAATDDLFRAIDIETGETVWDTPLPAGGQANPFIYAVDGRDYVGIMSGGHHFMETPIGDYVTVWALP